VPCDFKASLTAIELMSLSVSDSRPRQFLHCESSDLDTYLPLLRDKALQETIQSGIGYYHEGILIRATLFPLSSRLFFVGLSETEKKAIKFLFSTNAVQILVCTREVCWEVDVFCHLVVVMDTQYYDGRDHRFPCLPSMSRVFLRVTCYCKVHRLFHSGHATNVWQG
jgi:pre-mRNA-splicing helicase BRR2